MLLIYVRLFITTTLFDRFYSLKLFRKFKVYYLLFNFSVQRFRKTLKNKKNNLQKILHSCQAPFKELFRNSYAYKRRYQLVETKIQAPSILLLSVVFLSRKQKKAPVTQKAMNRQSEYFFFDLETFQHFTLNFARAVFQILNIYLQLLADSRFCYCCLFVSFNCI